MSFKYTILNVSYEQPFDFQPIQARHHRTISRYSDYTRRNKINDHVTDDKQLIGRILPHDSPKISLYQQYKNREMRKKMKLDHDKTSERPYHTIIVRGSVKHKTRTEYEHQKNLLTPEGIQPLHSFYKPQTPNVRRRFSMSLNAQRDSPNKQNFQKPNKVIGIQGIKTSFLDKYKLKMAREKQDLDEDETNKRFNRRQILCSTKRNRSLEPRLLKTTQNKRKNSKDQGNSFNILNIYRHDKIECRPWSPTKDEEFQKL